MNLSDYETPDPYAPRPKASQAVAAQKRAAQPQADDEPPAPAPPRVSPQLLMGIVGVLTVVGVLALAIGQHGMTAPTPLSITPLATAPAQVFETSPTAAPAATTAPTAIDQVSAYAAPDGVLLGPIEITRQITPIAHYGTDWVQANVAGSGLVWLRAGDMPSLAITGPDLAPAAAQPAQTGRGLTLSPGDGQPDTATPEPPAEPTATVVWATAVPVVKAPDFAQPSTSATCKLIGCLGAKAVDAAREQACHALYWQYGDSENIPEPDSSAVRQCVWEGLYK